MGISFCDTCGFKYFDLHKPGETTEDSSFQGLFSAICIYCLESYDIPTISPWGIARGEVLHLCKIEHWKIRRGPINQRSKTRYVQTGLSVIAADSDQPFDKMVDLSALACPCCGRASGLKHVLTSEVCPKCGAQPLKENLNVD